ncbi:DJ-1/PfpI family protein [Psychrobacillus sp.]|uniref:DJ-1/PfpI family protein n=1 Tax=Psychrobacillus sp. TaxID=1871623 RepID=UPI0028BEB40B|nr:DJ-1/PfpI family protein [Psychrobacillus sp.]
MVNVLFFAHPQYADFEIAHTLFFLKKLGQAKVTTVSVNGKSVESVGGLTTKVEVSLHDVNLEAYDLLLIPGGDGIDELVEEDIISTILNRAISLQIPIASICGSAVLLAKAGIVNNKKITCNAGTFERNSQFFSECTYTGNDVEVEQGFITAKGTAFPEFTVETCKLLGLLKDDEQVESVLKFCRGQSA